MTTSLLNFHHHNQQKVYILPTTTKLPLTTTSNSHLEHGPTTTTTTTTTRLTKTQQQQQQTTTEPELYKLSFEQQQQQQHKRSHSNNNNNRLAYVDALVDANALVIESIWQLTCTSKSSNAATSTPSPTAVVVPLRTFIQEVLKRSRTTYSTLQTALFYLFRSRPQIKIQLSRMSSFSSSCWEDAYISCGRRMFLASLVVASKFVQDKTYRNSAWAKIAGLPVSEINAAERIFLDIIQYRLYISQPTFEQWHHLLHLHVETKTLSGSGSINTSSSLLNDFNGLMQQQPQSTSYYYHGNHNSGTSSTYQPPYNINNTIQYPQQQQQKQKQHHPLHNIITTNHYITNTKHHTNTTHYTHYKNTTTTSPTSPLSSNQNTPSPLTPSPPRQQASRNGWTIVLSPTVFLSSSANITTTKSRKRQRCCYNTNNNPPSLPLLSMSLPSSINSSPMQTPTQISPVKMNSHGLSTMFNWNNAPATYQNNSSVVGLGSMNGSEYYNSSDGGSNNKKRKYTQSTTNDNNNSNSRSCYNISHVRQRYD